MDIAELQPLGRPSRCTEAVAEEICRRLAEGESLRAICRDDHMPDIATVMRWVGDDRCGFRAQYTRAREAQAHALAEAALEHAIAADDPDPRLAFDARRWFAGKLLPKVYGNRVELEQTVRATISDEPMSMEEWFRTYGRQDGPAE